ncbi:MAG: ABC transporter substrate-binding protein [Chloroflexi bacterium]|nr:ABC transporter substrate-binding protein [Chloroflexota bacterium]
MARLGVVLLSALMLFGFGSTAQEAELTHLPIFASFVPNVQFAPLYVAIEEGLFAEAGFEVEIIHGDENVGVLQVAQGELPFGLISGEQVILARANGIPVRFIYAWFQKYPQAVVAPDTVTIETPEDLAGLRIGLPGPFGANYTALTALLSLAGLTESDVQMESIGYVAPDILCAGGVDAAVVYSNNEPLEIQRRINAGECGDITGINILQVADFANMASNGIVANEDTLANRPAAAWAVTLAFDGGSYRTITNPARAYLHSLNFVENLPQSPELIAALELASDEFNALLETLPSPEAIAEKRLAVRAELGELFDAAELAQFDVLLATLELWGHPERGSINEEAWVTTRDVMAQMGSIPADFDVSDAFTLEFIPMGIDYEGQPAN